MTVSSTTSKVILTGNGTNKSWPFSFRVLQKADLTVYLHNLTNGVISTVNSADWSVTTLPANSGTITYPLSGSAITSSYELIIVRTVDYDQLTDINNQTGFFADVVEDQFDKEVMMIQQLREELDRTIRLSVADTTTQELPSPEARKDTVFGFDENGDIYLYPDFTVSLAAAEAAAAAAAASASSLGLRPEAFGAVGDGTNDDTQAFLDMRTYIINQLGDGVTGPEETVNILLTIGKHYTYTNNKWMYGLPNVRIIGNGAKLECTSTAAYTIDINAFCFQDWNVDTGFADRGGTEARDYGHFVDTTAKGQTVVNLVTAADAANYSAGDIVLIGGFNNLDTGAPTEYRYFEYREVASADAGAGTVTLTERLAYDYSPNWPISHQDNFTGDDLGPARILRLNRPNRALTKRLEIEDVTFIRNRNKTSTSRVQVTGVLDVIFRGCDMTDMVETTQGSCRETFFQNCRFGNFEGDKLADTVVFEGCRFNGDLASFVGTKTVRFRDCTIQSTYVGVGARTVLWDNCLFDDTVDAPGNIEVMLSNYVSKRRVDTLRLRDCLFTGRDVPIYNVKYGFYDLITISAIGTSNELLISISPDYTDVRTIHPGMYLVDDTGAYWCQVTNIREYAADPTKVAIEVDWFTAVPTPPVVMNFMHVRDFLVEGVSGNYAHPRWRKEFRTSTFTMTQDSPVWDSTGANQYDGQFGYIEEVECLVTKAATGGATNLWVRNATPAGATFANIDVLTAGYRRFTANGVIESPTGAGDSFTASAAGFMKHLQINPRNGGVNAWSSTALQRPEFELTVRVRHLI